MSLFIKRLSKKTKDELCQNYPKIARIYCRLLYFRMKESFRKAYSSDRSPVRRAVSAHYEYLFSLLLSSINIFAEIGNHPLF